MSNRAWFVPPLAQGQLVGVLAISIGSRVVKCQLLNSAWRFPRKLLPRELPDDYARLAEMVRKLARAFGEEIDPILVGQWPSNEPRTRPIE